MIENCFSESALPKHVTQLETAGYVNVRKAMLASRQRTWLAITREGQAASRAHVGALGRRRDSEVAKGDYGPGGVIAPAVISIELAVNLWRMRPDLLPVSWTVLSWNFPV